MDKIVTQVKALGPNGQAKRPANPSKTALASSSTHFLCSRCRGRQFLHSLCAQCGNTHADKANKPVDPLWTKAMANQQKILDRLKSDLLKADSKPAPAAAADDLFAVEKLISLGSVPVKKKLELSDFGTSSSSPDQLLSVYRVGSCVRSIAYLLSATARAKKGDFNFHGGDVIFLLRNAIFKAPKPISDYADAAVRAMLVRWEKCKNSFLDSDSEPEQLLGFVEAVHAQKEMKWKAEAELNRDVARIGSCMLQHSIEDLIRFDPSSHSSLPRSSCGYCSQCGEFANTHGQKVCKNILQQKKSKDADSEEDSEESKESGGGGAVCGRELVRVVDYQHLCEALVWTSVFRDIHIEPMNCADGSCALTDVLKFMPAIRPYRSLESLGLANYKCQCYFLTHLVFILSGWGAVTLPDVARLFVEEYIFLITNLPVVMDLKDAELVGEFLCSLKILGVPDGDPQLARAHRYLLATEKATASATGNWVPSGADFHKRYHTAYCGLIGLSPLVAATDKDTQSKYFLNEWRPVFEARAEEKQQ